MSNPNLPAPVTLEALVKRSAYTERFKEVLGQKAPQFLSSLLAIGRTMSDVEPTSIIAAGMMAAVLDLPIEKSLGFAWIVPYREGDKKFAQFQIGAKGFIQLAQRSGFYSRMNACPVNKEAFKGYDDIGEPIIDWGAVDYTKEPAGYAFAFRLLNGFSKVCYWSEARVREHAKKYSQAYRKNTGPWKDEFPKMALKTVIKNELSDWGILSVEFRRGLQVDQAVQKQLEDSESHPDNPQEAIVVESEVTAAPVVVPPPPVVPPPQEKPPLTEPEKPADGTPQQQLEAFVIKECGKDFTTFQRWAIESGMIADASSLGGFSEVSNHYAKLCLRAKEGLRTGLNKIA